jgi:hypothetical protein
MIPDENVLPERDLNFALDRLKWLDQETTRYRDYEWKATSFHAAFFVAILYAILDPKKHQYLYGLTTGVLIIIGIYVGIAISHLVYIHFRLNARRNEKRDLLIKLGQEVKEKEITCWWGFCEGWGVIFPLGFMASLIGLAEILIVLLCPPGKWGVIFPLGFIGLVVFFILLFGHQLRK